MKAASWNRWLAVAVVTGAFWWGAAVFAQTSVQDREGTVRAATHRKPPLSVIVEIDRDSDSGQVIYLQNVDGLAPDIAGRAEAPGKYVFEGVGAGTWQVVAQHALPKLARVSFAK